MRVHHVVPHVHEPASGPSHSVTGLCASLHRQGVEVALHVLEPGPKEAPAYPVEVYPAWRFPRRVGVSPRMRRGLARAASAGDVLHCHSLWMLPNIYPGRAVAGTGCALVISPRGTLEPWSLRHSSWRKRVVWTLAQRRVVSRADCLHATSERERDSILRLGLPVPVAVISNGVDVPSVPPRSPVPKHQPTTRRVLSIGRLHPKKGLDLLIDAWAEVEPRFPTWELEIAGRDQKAYAEVLRRLIVQRGLRRVRLSPPVVGAAKARAYREADLFVLPSRSESFGMVVAEALAHGTPVVCSQEAPWPGLVDERCGWWVACRAEALRDGMVEAMSSPPEELRARGDRGRRWMQRDFTWETIGRRVQRLYSWLLGEEERPEFVHPAPGRGRSR